MEDKRGTAKTFEHIFCQNSPIVRSCVCMRQHVIWYNEKMISNFSMHIIYSTLINISTYLCTCTCCEKQFVLGFFSPAECGRWSQAQSDTAIKQHLVEMGWSLLHLWPSGLSVYTGVCVRMCVCPTASRSVGTPWPVWVMVPTWILCEMRQKSRKTHQLEDAKEEKRIRQLWKYLLSAQPDFTLF